MTRRRAEGKAWGSIERLCEQCGQVMHLFPSESFLRFCSRQCAGLWRTGKPGTPHLVTKPNLTHPAARGVSLGNGGFRADLKCYFRSRWEANYARYLRHMKRRYEYEPDTFLITLPDGTQHGYTPDFLVDGTHYVEVKGWMRADHRQSEVIRAAQAQLPKPLFLLARSQYAALEVAYSRLLAGWEGRHSPAPKGVPGKCAACGAQLGRFGRKYCSRQCAGAGKVGKPRTDATRAKLSTALLGKPLSAERRATLSIAQLARQARLRAEREAATHD